MPGKREHRDEVRSLLTSLNASACLAGRGEWCLVVVGVELGMWQFGVGRTRWYGPKGEVGGG